MVSELREQRDYASIFVSGFGGAEPEAAIHRFVSQSRNALGLLSIERLPSELAWGFNLLYADSKCK